LAIVRELVELHGGSASASSDGAGTGATLRVRLPTIVHGKAPGAERAARSLKPGPEANGLPDRLKGVHVLAVDDEEDALGLLRVVLESAGAEVTTAGSAHRALDLLQSAAFDASSRIWGC